MNPAGRWMWLSLGLTLVVGLGLGVIVDRLLLQPTLASDTVRQTRGPYWFHCSEKLTDVEEDPAYPYTEKYRRVLLTRLSDDLSLSADQRRSLEMLLEERRATARQFWDETRTYYCYLQGKFRDEIRDLLDEEQKRIFADMVAKLDARQAELVRRSRFHPEKKK